MSEKAQPSKIISLGDVAAEPPRYLWEPYLRKGNLNIIRGDGGAGKTMLAVAIAAAISRGVKPDRMPGLLHITEPENVFIMSNEDDSGELRHRLDLCGADASRIFSCNVLDCPTINNRPKLTGFIRETNALLLILDPLQAFLPHGVDINSASDMRPVLDALRAVCRETDCTALVLEHLNKAGKMSAIQRGIGSMDIINASRSTLYVCQHPRIPSQRVALHIKANAARGRTIAFSIDGGVFSWAGSCDVSEDDVQNVHPKAPAVDNPVMVLLRALADQPNGWEGTSAQMAGTAPQYGVEGLSAVMVGKSIVGLKPMCERENIIISERNTSRGTWYSVKKVAPMT